MERPYGAAPPFVPIDSPAHALGGIQSRADMYYGGSAAGIVFARCVAEANATHLKDLRAFERSIGPK
jgi:hypothetical protein